MKGTSKEWNKKKKGGGLFSASVAGICRICLCFCVCEGYYRDPHLVHPAGKRTSMMSHAAMGTWTWTWSWSFWTFSLFSLSAAGRSGDYGRVVGPTIMFKTADSLSDDLPRFGSLKFEVNRVRRSCGNLSMGLGSNPNRHLQRCPQWFVPHQWDLLHEGLLLVVHQLLHLPYHSH